MAQAWSIAIGQSIEIAAILPLAPTSTGYQYCTGRATGWAAGGQEVAPAARGSALGMEAGRRRRLRLRAQHDSPVAPSAERPARVGRRRGRRENARKLEVVLR
jgi:hypothetical protein